MNHNDAQFQRPIGVLFDKVKSGRNSRVVGYLTLNPDGGEHVRNIVLGVVDDGEFRVESDESMFGISPAGDVSLIDCIRGGPANQIIDFRCIQYGDIPFRYVLFGHRHLAEDDASIREIEFTLEGAAGSVFPNNAAGQFVHLRNPDQSVLDAINRTKPEYQKAELTKGQTKVAYFTGEWSYLSEFETVLGTVSIVRSLRSDVLSPLEAEEPRISITFGETPVTIGEAWRRMRRVRHFFAWMIGYAPRWRDVKVFVMPDPEDELQSVHELLVFGPNESKAGWDPENSGHAGINAGAINATRHPDRFISVMQEWLKRDADPARKKANDQFFGCLPGTPARLPLEAEIVTAANAFDLLPEGDKPPQEPLPEDLRKIVDDARSKVHDCPASEQRAAVSNALAQISRNSPLRQCVEARVEIVLEHFEEDALKHLKNDIADAVRCRHYHTHGGINNRRGPDGIDYADFDAMYFFAKTLEFIYGASELLLCGWRPDNAVIFNGRRMFGAYIDNCETWRKAAGLHTP